MGHTVRSKQNKPRELIVYIRHIHRDSTFNTHLRFAPHDSKREVNCACADRTDTSLVPSRTTCCCLITFFLLNVLVCINFYITILTKSILVISSLKYGILCHNFDFSFIIDIFWYFRFVIFYIFDIKSQKYHIKS